jgi:hypothetical protein
MLGQSRIKLNKELTAGHIVFDKLTEAALGYSYEITLARTNRRRENDHLKEKRRHKERVYCESGDKWPS